MAQEIIYAELNVLEDSSPTSQPSLLKHQDLQGSSRWHRLILWIAVAGNVILATVVIALGIQVFQGHLLHTDIETASTAPESGTVSQRNSPIIECNTSLVDVVSLLKSNLCQSAQNTSAGSSNCKLCPMDWLSHKGKCYWFSKEDDFWNKSHDDCLAKSSQMLMIQEWEEMEFISNFTNSNYHVWLGLRVKSPEKKWTWVDNSELNQTRFTVLGPTDGNSCGVIKNNQIHSEICSAVFKWICQKKAVVL